MSEEITIEMLKERVKKVRAQLKKFDKDIELIHVAREKRIQAHIELGKIEALLNLSDLKVGEEKDDE